VFAGGMGRRPWSVDVITDVTVVPTPDEVILRLASGEGGAEGIGLGPPPEGAEGIGGIEIGPDGAGGEKDGAWVDSDGVGCVRGGFEGISPIGSTCDCTGADGTRPDPTNSETALVRIIT
jgi:hypothetical protein